MEKSPSSLPYHQRQCGYRLSSSCKHLTDLPSHVQLTAVFVIQFADRIDATLYDLERLMELHLNSTEKDVRRFYLDPWLFPYMRLVFFKNRRGTKFRVQTVFEPVPAPLYHVRAVCLLTCAAFF